MTIKYINPISLINNGQQKVSTAFTEGEILKHCCDHNLGIHMEIAGKAMLEGRLSSLLSLCDEKLEDPSYGGII